MKKKVLMIITAVALVIAMMPAMAFAEDGDITVKVTIKNDNFTSALVNDQGTKVSPRWTGTLVDEYEVTLPRHENATYAIEKACSDNGIAFINDKSWGSSFFKNFDGLKGGLGIQVDSWGSFYDMSGWKFLVNGAEPGYNGTDDMVNDISADQDKQLNDRDVLTMAYSVDGSTTDMPFIQCVVLDKTAVKTVKGKSVSLTASVLPGYGAVAANGVTWSSSDKTVAAVNTSGKVTAKSAGIAKIKATASNTLFASCKVTILPAKTSITKLVPKKKAVTVKWKKQNDATGYVILRAAKKTGTFKTVKTITKKTVTSWTNKNLKSGKKYFYKVKVYKTSKGGKVYSPLSPAKGVKTK